MTDRPSLIGLDWGTSHFRAGLIAADGSVLEERTSDDGLSAVKDAAFEPVLDEEIEAWETAHPGLPIIASGMVTSRQGWIETAYLPCPAGLTTLAGALKRVETPRGRVIHFVPGLSIQDRDAHPDVMRGEETQILGFAASDGRRSIVLPGTHSKWAVVEGDALVTFKTWITGDAFAALKGHSILKLFMVASEDSEEAFLRGLATGVEKLGAGLLGKLFSARTLGLFGLIPPEHLADYLSGLLIGAEIAEAEVAGFLVRGAPITIIGSSALMKRYLSALTHLGFTAVVHDGNAAFSGHLKLARAGGLLA